jgi:protein deglycase
MSTACVVLADGFEEMEAVAPIDLLRRAGVDVTVAGLPGTELTGRNGIRLVADRPFSEICQDTFDLIVLPGGPAFKILLAEASLLDSLRRHEAHGALLGAICAAPTVLHAAGLLDSRQHTAHFSVQDQLPRLDPSPLVIEDRRVITSQGAGTATQFALALVHHLCGEASAHQIAASICFPR